MAIGSLARRTGVPVDTLRAWERRYGVLRPTRTDGGQRRYGNEDVERVLWLAARVAEGQRISDAVSALTALETADSGVTEACGPTVALAARLSGAARQGEGRCPPHPTSPLGARSDARRRECAAVRCAPVRPSPTTTVC